MRNEGGIAEIEAAVNKLSFKHVEHLFLYGDNSKRLTGHHETSSKDKFSYGVGNRAASCRIPTSTIAEKKGYFEDRRPASDIDPYIVGAALIDTTLLTGDLLTPLLEHYGKWAEWKKDVKFE